MYEEHYWRTSPAINRRFKMTKNALQQFLDRYKTLKEDQELRPGKDILTTEFHVRIFF